MRYTVKGADSLAKVIGLEHNGMLSGSIRKRGDKKEAEKKRGAVISATSLLRQRLKEEPEHWLKAHMPVLYGPDSDAPWVKVLRGISQISKAV